MKYIVMIGDGMADEPCARLEGKTPLAAAQKPYMNYLASMGVNGLVDTVPEGMTPESDTANLAIMGYDPRTYSRGRSPLEALSMGIEMQDDETAIRANLVSLSDEGEPYEEKRMLDHSADEIPTEQAAELIAAVQAALGGNGRTFYAGVSYRHCLIYKNCPAFTDYTRPHDILGKTIRAYLPQRRESAPFLEMQKRSFDLLNAHPLNLRRAAQGLKKANSLWFWGPGKKPSLPPFSEKYGLRATVVSAVDLIKGIGVCAGMRVVDVPGAPGTLDTHYRGKLEAAAARGQRSGVHPCGSARRVRPPRRADEQGRRHRAHRRRDSRPAAQADERQRRGLRRPAPARPSHPRARAHAHARAGAVCRVQTFAGSALRLFRVRRGERPPRRCADRKRL